MKRNSFVGLLLCVVVCLSGFVGYSVGVGAAPNFSDYYLDQSVAPYSYMICTDNNGWYWAVNGSNGAVCWTSTNAYTPIQNALNSGGGVDVYLNFIGAHALSHGLVMDKGNQRLHGIWHGSTSSRSTWLTIAASVGEDALLINGTINPDYYGVKDITFSQANTTKSGIKAISALHLELENLQVYGGAYGYNLESSQKNRYINLYAEGSTSQGFLFSTLSYVNYLQDLTAYNCSTNFYFQACSGVEAHNLMSYSSSTYSGIFLDSCYDMQFYSTQSFNNNNDGIILYGSYRILFNGGTIYDNARAGSGYWSNILAEDNAVGVHSVNNTVVGVNIYDSGSLTNQYTVNLIDANQTMQIIGGYRYGWTVAEFNGTATVFT